MSLQKQRFALGIVAGLALAAVVIGASTLAGTPAGASLMPLYSTDGRNAATSATTAVTSSTTTQTASATLTLPLQAATNSTLSTSTSSAAQSSDYLANVQAPASSANIAGQVLHSAVLLLPVLAALFFGLLVYRASAGRETPD
jgi:hypothetical protein